MLIAFQLLREFQMILPNNWFRYSEKLVEQLMKKTMEFMLECRSGAKPSLLDSLTIYALIDGSALWWKKWLHSEFARKKILKCLEENDGLTAVWGSLKIGKQKSKILESRSYYCVQLLTTAAQYQTFINHLNMTVVCCAGVR